MHWRPASHRWLCVQCARQASNVHLQRQRRDARARHQSLLNQSRFWQSHRADHSPERHHCKAKVGCLRKQPLCYEATTRQHLLACFKQAYLQAQDRSQAYQNQKLDLKQWYQNSWGNESDGCWRLQDCSKLKIYRGRRIRERYPKRQILVQLQLDHNWAGHVETDIGIRD